MIGRVGPRKGSSPLRGRHSPAEEGEVEVLLVVGEAHLLDERPVHAAVRRRLYEVR